MHEWLMVGAPGLGDPGPLSGTRARTAQGAGKWVDTLQPEPKPPAHRRGADCYPTACKPKIKRRL